MQAMTFLIIFYLCQADLAVNDDQLNKHTDISSPPAYSYRFGCSGYSPSLVADTNQSSQSWLTKPRDCHDESQHDS